MLLCIVVGHIPLLALPTLCGRHTCKPPRSWQWKWSFYQRGGKFSSVYFRVELVDEEIKHRAEDKRRFTRPDRIRSKSKFVAEYFGNFHEQFSDLVFPLRLKEKQDLLLIADSFMLHSQFGVFRLLTLF